MYLLSHNKIAEYLLLTVLLLVYAATVFASDSAKNAEYVGREVCTNCHEEQVGLWQGSHHDLAMQHADENSVRGDFSNIAFTHAGITSKFFKNNKKFMVRTDGADGKLHDFEIKYTFGVTPLQQYLVELEGGRLQALSIAWDTREKSAGGQRWFHLYPDEKVTHTDELHWTRYLANWNGMCAECHSTNLQKNYDSQSDNFKTSWSEINVSCEACHGPASNHLIWANNISDNKPDKKLDNKTAGEAFKNKGFNVLFDERKDILWKLNDDTGSAVRSDARKSKKEIDVCAQCHSRRSVISDDYSPGKPFLNHYKPSLLDEGMYFADGQIEDEVYVYGSFMQSKMQHKGVTCSDCHEPHSLKLRQEGNGVCLQCHAANRFDTKKHHFHETDSKAALCAECHMPARTYMVVDPRHDHSIRIPRPDLSVSLGTPNACNQCHRDKDATWAASQVKQWYGKAPEGYQQFAATFDAGRLNKPGAAKMLVQQIKDIETPNIARASAISSLSSYLDQTTFDVLKRSLKDEDALVRMASVTALEGIPQEMLVPLIFPLLDDPVRTIRIEAARVLAPVPVGQLLGEQLTVYKRAASEYINSQRVNADRPEAQLNLGNYYAVKNEFEKSELAYKTAIKLDDTFVPAYINLADLHRAQQNDAEAENILRKVIGLSPANASASYALGLLYVRKQDNDKALEMLQRTVELEPSNAHYTYVYAVALNSAGKKDDSIAVLQSAQSRFPRNRDILNALVAFHRDAGNDFVARNYMNKLKKLNSSD